MTHTYPHQSFFSTATSSQFAISGTAAHIEKTLHHSKRCKSGTLCVGLCIHTHAMPAAIFFGSLLLAFGPLLAVTLLFVSQRAHLLLVMLARAFCASLGLLLASGLWWMIPPLRVRARVRRGLYPSWLDRAVRTQDAPLAVIAQMVVGLEVAHLLFLWGYGRADRALKQLSMLRVPMDDVTSGIGARRRAACSTAHLTCLLQPRGPGRRR